MEELRNTDGARWRVKWAFWLEVAILTEDESCRVGDAGFPFPKTTREWSTNSAGHYAMPVPTGIQQGVSFCACRELSNGEEGMHRRAAVSGNF